MKKKEFVLIAFIVATLMIISRLYPNQEQVDDFLNAAVFSTVTYFFIRIILIDYIKRFIKNPFINHDFDDEIFKKINYSKLYSEIINGVAYGIFVGMFFVYLNRGFKIEDILVIFIFTSFLLSIKFTFKQKK